MISSLKSTSVYHSDYCSQIYNGKGTEIEERKRADHTEFLTRMNAFLEDRPIGVDMNCLIESMQKYEETMPPDDYSEGGSDSEFSDEDLDGAERRALLDNIIDYTKSYASGCVVKNFTSQIKKEILRVAKKKKNDVEEFIKFKELKKRFEQLEKYGSTEVQNVDQKPEIKPILTQTLTKEATNEHTLESVRKVNKVIIPKSRLLPDAKNNIRRSLHRDNTMPQLSGNQSKIVNKSTVIPKKKYSNSNKSIFDKYDDVNAIACRQMFQEYREDDSKLYYSMHRKESEDIDQKRFRRMIRANNELQMEVVHTPNRSIINTTLPKVKNPAYKGELRGRIAQSILTREVNQMHTFLRETPEQHREFYQNPTVFKKPREPVSIKVHTIELNVIHQQRAVVYRKRDYRCTPLATKFFIKSPDFLN